MLQNAKKRILSYDGKILLGLSGGPDSMCLYHLLKECNKEFVVAHIDHGMREESSLEEEKLLSLAKEDSIPFFSKRLDIPLSTNNLEDRLRGERIAFFKEVLINEGLDYLFLGHQKDERAETIIKRFFEGGSIFHLPAITEKSIYEGISIIRPLIETTKKEILKYLALKESFYFIDPTNVGDKNLRARMRSSMIPKLEEAFGKNITNSVCDSANQVLQVQGFVKRSLKLLEEKEVDGPFGTFFPREDIDSYLYGEWVLSSLKQKGMKLSREQKLIIEKGKIGKRLNFARYDLCLEEVGVFLLDKSLPFGTTEKKISWLEFWKKGVKLHGFSAISKEAFCSLIDKKKCSEFHRIEKTPLCMRVFFPISLTAIRKNIKIKDYILSKTL